MKNPLARKRHDTIPKIQGPEKIDTGKGPIPAYRNMLQLIAGDQRGHALNQLISSDKNNALKTRIHNVFNMSVADTMSHWEEFDTEIEAAQYFLNGRIGQDEGGYRINSMAEDGLARVEFVEGFKAWSLLGQFGGQAQSADSRLTEGSVKK